jgi:hypothetical protein
MEENITQQRTNAIKVTLYTNLDITWGSSGLAEKKSREIIYSKGNLSAVPPLKGPVKNEIIVLAGENTEGSPLFRLQQYLEKKAKPFIYIPVDKGNLGDEVNQITDELEKALDMGFTAKDFVQVYNRNITFEKIRKQLLIFKNGISKIELKKPAVINDGIHLLTKETARQLAGFYDSKKNGLKIQKFVPASGAATRMFKFLNEFMQDYDPDNDTLNAYINRKKDNALSVFIVGLDKFPFYRAVMEQLKKNPEYGNWDKSTRIYNFIKTMLTDAEFDYANKPKGILPFHQYPDFTATPIYEHLHESVTYANSKDEAHVHFTISEEHLNGFLDAINDVKDKVEKASGKNINFGFSYQHKRTDTLAVDMNNIPFRDDEGNLLFRPGGHGALIENLNNLESDIVFIKNIDNVSYNNTDIITLYKKALGGLLIELQEKIFDCLKKIDTGNINEEEIELMLEFAKQNLSVHIPRDVAKYTYDNKIEYLKDVLNRPIRVCGMVKNEGEPGGGPFWVEEDNGAVSLQIVESSQVDHENKAQVAIFSKATHFNPVDIVCGLKNFKDEYFDLTSLVDPGTGFIVYKNRLGTDVKSYELPGLWNGAMAGWITVFAEVPLETFSPVKTVNDLLKPAHQQ